MMAFCTANTLDGAANKPSANTVLDASKRQDTAVCDTCEAKFAQFFVHVMETLLKNDKKAEYEFGLSSEFPGDNKRFKLCNKKVT
jgi:hypothetical protein